MRVFLRALTFAALALTFLVIASARAAAQTNSPSTNFSAGNGPDPYANATLWTLKGDYAHFFSSSLGGFDYYGLAGSLKLNLDTDLALQFEGGYHHVTFTNGDANDFMAGGSLVFERQGMHFGPSFAFQSSAQGGATSVTATTFNYGGFAQFYIGSNLSLSGSGGGFHTDAARWNGFYLSGSAEWYPTSPDFAIAPSINFMDVPGGSFPFRETDFIAGFEWKPVTDLPVSIYTAYAYSAFSNHDHANTIYVALKFYGGAGDEGASAPLLVQRYEAVDVTPIIQGLVFKY